MREGDPAALTALCAARGPSVVAYCRHVAGSEHAGAAAADAFARFRVGVVRVDHTASVDPEALLISATRTSAAAHANTTAGGYCAEVPALLAARAEKTLAPVDLERLESHLEQCWACRAPVARFKAAERAYGDPPEKSVDPALNAQIVGALIAAVPPAPPPDAAPVSSNGSAPHAPALDPAVAPDVPLDQPTEQFAAPDMHTAEPAAGDREAATDPAAPGRLRRAKAYAVGGGLLAALRPSSKPRASRKQPQAPDSPMPREPRLPAVGSERSGRSRRRLRLAFVLPIVLVLVALVGALYVSGIFGGNAPESSPTVAVPAAEPVDTTKPELVIVPGAKDATADAVEAAKARARGEGEPSVAKKDKAKKDAAKADDAPARAPSPSPPATVRRSAPAPASAPSAPPASESSQARRPAPTAEPRPTEEKQLDAGGGAVAPEQVAPPAGGADAPGLAPPAGSPSP